ncbi:MAG: hypothetical protein SVR94_09995 [Pseudomonadota bacterium]|nr:hypothetical protein [Pseudomonadota bacterium]
MPKNLQNNTFLRMYQLSALFVAVLSGFSVPTIQAVEKPIVSFLATEKIPPAQYSDEQFENKPQPGPIPFVSFLPTTEVEHIDWHYWRAFMRYQGEKKKQQDDLMSSVQSAALGIEEAESSDTFAENDSQNTAQFISNFGSATANDSKIVISGYLASKSIPTHSAFPEDDGSVPLASLIEISSGETVKIENAEIGDGPYGSSGTGSGDFDFYRISAQSNDIIIIDVDTPQPYEALDPFVAVYDDSGTFLDFNDDDSESYDSYLSFVVPADGDYLISIGGYGAFTLNDPMDSASGPGFGSEGVYDVTLSLNSGESDVDFYSFSLNKGDILGATVTGAGNLLTLFSADGTELMGSNQDGGFIYPQASELPWGGNATVSFVSNKTDSYAIRVIGNVGDYTLKLEVFRPILEQEEENAKQILYLDFNGATFDSAIFEATGVVTLSPLDDFLANWGFTPADKDALIDIILDTAIENIQTDIRAHGLNGDFSKSNHNGDFDVEILNSRDESNDPFGLPHVSRVIVGGTRFELGMDTIGIAQSIDVGNFETEETAVVLLDILSGGFEWGNNSLNAYPVQPPKTKLELVGTAIGNLIAHEAGHLFGNWHTEQFLTLPNLMDQGGNMPGMIGVGDDFVFGTGDDVDVDFGEDLFNFYEGFTGIEDTLNVIAFGLPAKAPEGGLLVHLDYARGKASAQGNRLTWHTLTERDTAGFCIVRAQQDDQGHYTDVTFLKPAAPQTLVTTTATQCTDEHLIAATGEGTTYRYFDRAVNKGITYHYLIRDFDMQGQITDHWAHKMVVTTQ